MRRCKYRVLTALLLASVLLLSGCGQQSAAKASKGLAPGQVPYAIPDFLDSGFHTEQAETAAEGFLMDGSCFGEGYIALRANRANRLKFQIQCGEMLYTYDLPGDGSDTVLPLNMGSGDYDFRLMEHVGDGRYACIWSDTRAVSMKDEFQCFLRPSQMADYDADSECVRLARELASNCAADIDVVGAVYDYLVKNIHYDREKAATVAPGYLPDPDRTLAEGKGICFDYASLAAAMMRSLGIPCKLITGFVDGDVYHAWNCFYIQGQGWVTVGIQASPRSWQRVDITFAAGGRKTSDLTDDGRYTARYTY